MDWYSTPPGTLRRQPLDPPGGAQSTVPQSVVEPVAAPLPELQGFRRQAVPAPEGRERRRLRVQGLQPGHLGLERPAVDDDAALGGRGSRDATAVGPPGPILLGFLSA